MSEDANPNQNNRSCPRILAAVAAALPVTTSQPRTITLAECGRYGFEHLKDTSHPGLKRGDASAIRSIISVCTHTLSPYSSDNQACMALLSASLHDGCRYPLA